MAAMQATLICRVAVYTKTQPSDGQPRPLKMASAPQHMHMKSTLLSGRLGKSSGQRHTMCPGWSMANHMSLKVSYTSALETAGS